MTKIVFLVSGNGGNLKFIFNAIVQCELSLKIIGVISDRECGAIKFSRNNGVYSQVISDTNNFQALLRDAILGLSPDIVITNIHKIIEGETISIETIKFLNLHYSILPSYSGLIGMKTILNARAQNNMFLGCTCHIVEETVDAGKILGQAVFPVDWSWDLEYIYDIVFKSGCLSLFNHILKATKSVSSHSYSQLLINLSEVSFNPPLVFDPYLFNDSFWENLK